MDLVNKTRLIYKGGDFICISKPSGLLVHSAPHMKRNNEPTLVDWLIENFPSVKDVGDDTDYRPGIIHRLDKETSGIMIVPLNQEMFVFMKKLFSEHKIKKTYKAIVQGDIKEEGRIDVPIGIKSGTVKRTLFSGKMSKDAITDFKKEYSFEKNKELFSLVSVMPKTGRTHQIRVHMNSIHHPVIGDPLYGGKKNKKLAERLMLHAFSLEFEDTKGRNVYLESSLPKDFVSFLDLGENN